MATPAPSSGGTIAPCAFTLDVQWILDAIERVQSMVRRIRDFCNTALDHAERILRKLSGILSWFCWMPAGRFAKTVVDNACRVIRGAVNSIATIYDRIYEAMKGVLAPWQVRSAGRQIRDDLAPKCEQFASLVNQNNLASVTSWTGAAADLFGSSMDRQSDAATNVAEDAREFGESVESIGADGIVTTVTFISSLVIALAGLASAIIGMIGVPIGTVAGAAAAIGLVGAIISFIMVFVSVMMSINSQISSLQGAAGRVSGGQWPAARF